MLTRNEADAIINLIEEATDGTWPQVAAELTARGCKLDACTAVAKLAELARVSVPFTEKDF